MNEWHEEIQKERDRLRWDEEDHKERWREHRRFFRELFWMRVRAVLLYIAFGFFMLAMVVLLAFMAASAMGII